MVIELLWFESEEAMNKKAKECVDSLYDNYAKLTEKLADIVNEVQKLEYLSESMLDDFFTLTHITDGAVKIGN